VSFRQIPVQGLGTATTRHRPRLRCPFCHVTGVLDVVGTDQEIHVPNEPLSFFVGSRSCANADCRAHIFIVYELDGDVVVSYPPEVIDFDATNLPEPVLRAFGEAIQCHATNSYIAAAIMVRKTLEELCADRGAEGENLKDRIAALRERIVLPEDLLEGLDDLRLLGNDAAHIKSRVFNEVGQEEVEVGIEFTKEVLKAAYQHADLLARLRGLRRDQSGKENA
jgi:hypothetical protein